MCTVLTAKLANYTLEGTWNLITCLHRKKNGLLSDKHNL